MIGTSLVRQEGADRVRKCVASDIEFDFSVAKNLFEHDTTNPKCQGGSIPDGNTGWPGVDFREEEDQGWIWLEVKNWGGRMRGSFAHKMRSKEFAEEIRSKFLGTTAFLAWNERFMPAPVRYVLLFEPPNTSDPALLAPFQDLVRSEMPTSRALNISVHVMNIEKWNSIFPSYQARKYAEHIVGTIPKLFPGFLPSWIPAWMHLRIKLCDQLFSFSPAFLSCSGRLLPAARRMPPSRPLFSSFMAS